MSNVVSVRKLSMFGVALSLLALAAFLIVGQLNSTANAGSHQYEFTGFWMAVDSTDGGFNKLSLVDNGDGTVDLNLSETNVSSCAGGPATLSGVGDIVAGDLVVPITIQCLPAGATIGPLPVTFVVLDDNLIEFQFAPAGIFVPYHRVSQLSRDSKKGM